MYEDKAITEPIKKEKLGKIIRKGGEWYDNHTKCEPHDTIEGYVLETSYNDLQENNKSISNENNEYYHIIKNLEKKVGNIPDTETEENPDHLNLMYDIKRIEKIIRRLDKRSRISKDTDVTVRCANAIGLLEGKKLLLIQAVTHVKKKNT